MLFNPQMRPWDMRQPNNVAGQGCIEIPSSVVNIIWQNRTTVPTDYENTLGNALERCFERGVDTLPELVRQLNDMGFRSLDGSEWSEASLGTELHSLAA
jgi:hypothetical protein